MLSRSRSRPCAASGDPRSSCIVLAILVAGCGGQTAVGPTPTPTRSTSSRSSTFRARPQVPEVEVVFHDGKAFAREGGREWPIAEVGRNEMLWAPDGLRFAYLKEASASAPISALLSPRRAGARSRGPTTTASIRASALGVPSFHVVFRNIRGDSVNEFPVYRRGKPTELDWIDNAQIGYLAPPDPSGDAYVIHNVESGEVTMVHRGRGFTWSPGRKQLAYLAGKPSAISVKVGALTIWPREGTGSVKGRRKIVGGLVWSPDGQSLAFRETVGSKGTLVVILVLDNKEGDLAWPLPSGALEPEHRIVWDESEVTLGVSGFKPRFAASWRRVR